MFWQAPSSPHVLALLKGRRPAAIAGSIGPVIVDSIDRHSGRRFAHVFEESLEAIAPTVADSNSATAVVLEPLVFGIEATLFHCCPTFECTRAPASVRASERAELFAMKTFATDNFPLEKAVAADDFLGSAVAPAIPHRPAVTIHVREADDSQSSESQTCDISEIRQAGLHERLVSLETASRDSAGPFRHYSMGVL